MSAAARRLLSLSVPIVLALVSAVAPGATALANGEAGNDPAVAAAAAACAARTADVVQRHYDAVRDIEAQFEQTTRSVALGTGTAAATQATRGRVLFAKPGRMRWHYESPAESLVVSDGETLWIYDPAAREVQRLPVTQGYLSGAALHFLLGEGRLADDFAIATRDDCSGDTVALLLTPKAEAAYERLSLTVRRTTGEMIATSVVDLFGNETTIAFSELRTNTAPAAERFRFEAPAGVRVLELDAQPE